MSSRPTSALQFEVSLKYLRLGLEIKEGMKSTRDYPEKLAYLQLGCCERQKVLANPLEALPERC